MDKYKKKGDEQFDAFVAVSDSSKKKKKFKKHRRTRSWNETLRDAKNGIFHNDDE